MAKYKIVQARLHNYRLYVRTEIAFNVLTEIKAIRPEWDEEVFEKVMAQAENFKKFNGASHSNNVIYKFSTEEKLSMVAQEVVYGAKKD